MVTAIALTALETIAVSDHWKILYEPGETSLSVDDEGYWRATTLIGGGQ